ncbi:hypothetical protein RIF29_34124 [Crotalaria pallida]|uniref:Uncharacterized protein n=1 Tax=Crotalaria pallida TaxID=3830 RepID=A0AAN9HX85_CROPI
MVKQKGMPPKTPTSTSKSTNGNDNKPSESPQRIDFSQLDDEDLADIDSLSPKQAELWIQKIDVLRAKIKQKTDNSVNNEFHSMTNGSSVKPVETSIPNTSSNPNIGLANKERDKPVNVCKKLRLLQRPLTDLSKIHFAKIDKRELDLKEKLARIQGDLCQV